MRGKGGLEVQASPSQVFIAANATVSVPVRGKGGLEAATTAIIRLRRPEKAVSVPVRGKGGLEDIQGYAHMDLCNYRFRPREGKGWSRRYHLMKQEIKS